MVYRHPMTRSAIPLLAILATAACQANPPSTEPSAAPPTAAEPEPQPQTSQHWLGSLALPNNQSLDWAIAIEPPADDPDGEAIAYLWIPTQMILRMPLGAPVINDNGQVEVSLAMVGATWTITPGEEPTCSFSQQGQSLPCDLEAVDAEEFAELMTPARPQTPKPPFPYAITEVTIDNPEAPGVTLAATLTVPEGPGPHPGLVLITGSGLQDRDETIAEHKPFWILADTLSRQGIAVLRYDDRGYAGSTGDPTLATLEDFASDARAVARWLAERPEIDGDRVGLLGHSEGGVVAPLIASQHPKDADFLVLLAGTGVPGHQIILHQLGLIMRASGADEAVITRELAQTKALHQALLDTRDATPDAAKAALAAVIREQFAALSDAERATLGDLDAAVERQVAAMSSPWLRHFLAYDPIPALKRVKVPVLVLFGDKDLQVDPEQNLAPMRAALKPNKRAEFVRFPGLNHLFQPATTGLPAEYGVIEQTLAPELLETVSTWLRSTTGLD
jgi:uncharacterized protein